MANNTLLKVTRKYNPPIFRNSLVPIKFYFTLSITEKLRHIKKLRNFVLKPVFLITCKNCHFKASDQLEIIYIKLKISY